jgi:hypothetical protein
VEGLEEEGEEGEEEEEEEEEEKKTDYLEDREVLCRRC